MHALVRADVAAAIDAAVTANLGRPWTATDFRDLDHRASHRCGICRGSGFDVFVKHSADADAFEQFTLECRGLQLLRDRTQVLVAEPVGDGVVRTADGALLLLVGLEERPPETRTTGDWRSIGGALATLHGSTAKTFGAGLDGSFGPLRQDNRPTPGATWIDCFCTRRVQPFLDAALRSGHLPIELAHRVEQRMDRLDRLGLDEPQPTLLHGDAQQNNFVSTDAGAVMVDCSPFYGHPENDLAMVEVFRPVPRDLFDGYRDVRDVPPGFDARCELWRIPVYLAVIAVDGAKPFGRSFVGRPDRALRRL